MELGWKKSRRREGAGEQERALEGRKSVHLRSPYPLRKDRETRGPNRLARRSRNPGNRRQRLAPESLQIIGKNTL
jgi:hypothetical protein